MIAKYLRKECSTEYRDSCSILGLDGTKVLSLETHLGKEEIRRAYLSKAMECHPDKRGDHDEFQSIKKAYEHLMAGGEAVKQRNPMHSIHLMLEIQKNQEITKTSSLCRPNENEKTDDHDTQDEMKLFKPRLIAVLLEYGEKGISLSNIPKVWNKVWPKNPFPCIQNDAEETRKKRKKGQLLGLIQEHAGDVISVVRQAESGILIKPRNISHDDITQFVTEQVQTLEIIT